MTYGHQRVGGPCLICFVSGTAVILMSDRASLSGVRLYIHLLHNIVIHDFLSETRRRYYKSGLTKYLLSLNNQCQDLRLFRFQFRGHLSHRPSRRETKFLPRKRDTEMYHFSCLLERPRRKYSYDQSKWKVLEVDNYDKITPNPKLHF